MNRHRRTPRNLGTTADYALAVAIFLLICMGVAFATQYGSFRHERLYPQPMVGVPTISNQVP